MAINNNYKKAYTEDYAKNYNNLYLLDDVHHQHFSFEIEVLEKLLSNKKTWLDVACGTGLHLDTVKVPHIKKFGLDRSEGMLSYAKKNTCESINYILDDIGSTNLQDSFDLVSFLWMGYVHSASIKDSLSVIYSASEKVNYKGDYLLTFCDPLHIFQATTDKKMYIDRGYMSFDGIFWSYKDDKNGIEYTDLVAPNKFKILDMLSKDYESVREIVYPKKNDLYWRKSALLFQGKKELNHG